MRDAKFFTQPQNEWQRRYEALRGSFVERQPAQVVAGRFGYSAGYIHRLRHQFRHGKIDFNEPVPEGKLKRRKVTAEQEIKVAFLPHGGNGASATALLEQGGGWNPGTSNDSNIRVLRAEAN